MQGAAAKINRELSDVENAARGMWRHLPCLRYPAFAEGFTAQHDHSHIQGEGRTPIACDIAEDLGRYDAALREVVAVDPQLPKNPLEIYGQRNRKIWAARLRGLGAAMSLVGKAATPRGAWLLKAKTAGQLNVNRWRVRCCYTNIRPISLIDTVMKLFLHGCRKRLPNFIRRRQLTQVAQRSSLNFPKREPVTGRAKISCRSDSSLLSSPLELTGKVHRERFYNRAWLLVHMTEFTPEWRARLARYRCALHAGQDVRAAAAAFGDLQALNAAERDAGRLTAAYERAARVAAQYPHNADAHCELAKVADALGRPAKGCGPGDAALRTTREEALDRSLVLQGDQPAANLLCGQAAMDRLRAKCLNDEPA